MPQPDALTARALTQRIASGELTRCTVVERHLDLIAATNPAVGAFVTVRRDQALREAQQADAEGGARGPLDGVPVSVKAEYDVAGVPTSHGNRELAEQPPARRDSPVVARLRRAGAIVVGKGNQPDFAMRWNTHSSQLGWTRNPRDLSCSVGGSSGGDAAAVAAGMVPIGFGTDLAGSIRVPAAFCQIFGLRSTPGRIPYASEDPAAVRTPAVEAMSSQGPLARSVDDLRVAFEVTAGASPEHPFSTSVLPVEPPLPRGARIARITDQAGAVVEPAVRARLDEACAALAAAGYEIEDAAFPGIGDVPDLWGQLVCTELRLLALPRLRELMDPSCADHIDKLSRLWPTLADTEAYVSRWEDRARTRRVLLEWMDEFPLIICPIAGTTVPLPLEYDHWAGSDELDGLAATMRNSLWPACLGLPAIAFPDGLQLVAAANRDEQLFEPARVLEQALPACLPANLPTRTATARVVVTT